MFAIVLMHSGNLFTIFCRSSAWYFSWLFSWCRKQAFLSATFMLSLWVFNYIYQKLSWKQRRNKYALFSIDCLNRKLNEVKNENQTKRKLCQQCISKDGILSFDLKVDYLFISFSDSVLCPETITAPLRFWKPCELQQSHLIFIKGSC